MRLERPDSGLRRLVNDALAGKHARLVKLSVEVSGAGWRLGDRVVGKQLQDLDVDSVFVKLHQSRFDADPGDDLMACFHEIVEEVEGGDPG